MQINDNIKLIRELSGKTQAEFAELIKTNLSNLKTYENTDTKPKAYLILNICKLAGISTNDLENKELLHEDIHFNNEYLPKEKIIDQSSAAFLAGQLSMAERLIAKLEASHEEAKSDKEKLFAALADNQRNIIEILKPMAVSLNGIPPVLESILRNTQEHDNEMMKALDKLVGNLPGTHRKESGKRIIKGALEQQKKGN